MYCFKWIDKTLSRHYTCHSYGYHSMHRLYSKYKKQKKNCYKQNQNKPLKWKRNGSTDIEQYNKKREGQQSWTWLFIYLSCNKTLTILYYILSIEH